MGKKSHATTQEAVCRLCLQPNPLCRSHIIPDFLYKPLFDEKHRLYLLHTDDPSQNRSQETGVWDRLLCSSCETYFSSLETYAKRIIFGGVGIYAQQLQNRFTFEGIDYNKFKLFSMSILWRAGITERPEFRNVKLGPHSERMRKMLLKGDPGEPYQYGCILLIPTTHLDIWNGMIMMPFREKMDGYYSYIFVLTGFLWHYFVGSHTSQIPWKELFLSKDGTLNIYMDTNHHANRLLARFVQAARRSGNLPN